MGSVVTLQHDGTRGLSGGMIMQFTTWPWRVGVNGCRVSNALRSKQIWRIGEVGCDWFWNCEMRVHNQQSSSIAAVCLVVSGVNRTLEIRTYSNLSQLKRFNNRAQGRREGGAPWVHRQAVRGTPTGSDNMDGHIPLTMSRMSGVHPVRRMFNPVGQRCEVFSSARSLPPSDDVVAS